MDFHDISHSGKFLTAVIKMLILESEEIPYESSEDLQ